MNTVNFQGTVQIANGNSTVATTIRLNETLTVSGSTFTSTPGTATAVNTGAFAPLPSGSNATLRYGIFTNADISGSVFIGIGSAVTSSVLAPGDFAVIPWRGVGQTIVYAAASGSTNPVQLNYTLVANT